MEIILFALFVVGIIAFRILQPKIKGYLGERSVAVILSFLPFDKYKIINDILIKSNDRTIQIDHLVISLYGIFVIETKNYKDGLQVQTIPNIGLKICLVTNINFIIQLNKIKLIF